MSGIRPQNVLLKSPRIKIWINFKKEIDTITGRSTLWVINFKKGIAKKPTRDHDVERTIKARYSTYRTHLDIEDYLLEFYCDNGFDIRLDVRNRKKGIIKFILPLIGRYSIEC